MSEKPNITEGTKVTKFYLYNEKKRQFEYNHYEEGWIQSPKKVILESAKWDFKHSYLINGKIND